MIIFIILTDSKKFSMRLDIQGKTVVIFGGAGFIGKCLVSELSKHPCKIFVVTRKPNNHEELRILAGLGQITIVNLEEYNEDNLTELLSGCDIVINLIGILAEQRGSSFQYVHEVLPNLLSKISKDVKIKKFIHLSALGVNKINNSKYAKSKLNGEIFVSKNFPDSIIIRPSVVFGAEDNFVNLFNKIASISPFLPIFGAPNLTKNIFKSFLRSEVKFQPIYVGDLVKFLIGKMNSSSDVYELCGPTIYTFDQIIKLILEIKKVRRILMPIPLPLASILGLMLEKLPYKLLTRDQVKLMGYENISTRGIKNLKKIVKNPKSMEVILPTYIR